MTGLVIPKCPHKVGLARGPVSSCSENSTAVSWTQVKPLGAAVAGQGGSTAEGKSPYRRCNVAERDGSVLWVTLGVAAER